MATPLQAPADELEEDRVLAAAAASKDSEAAGRLFDKYYSQISGYIYRSTLDHQVTEDLTSNVFLSAFKHLGLFRWRRVPFGAWLYRIATNEVRMHFRRKNRRSETNCGPLSLEVPSQTPTAPERLTTIEDYQLLHRGLLELSLKYRTVLLLRYFEGKSVAEIAAVTGRTQGTVKSQIHRGLQQLEGALQGLGLRKE